MKRPHPERSSRPPGRSPGLTPLAVNLASSAGIRVPLDGLPTGKGRLATASAWASNYTPVLPVVQGQSVIHNRILVGVAVVLPPPKNAGNLCVAEQSPALEPPSRHLLGSLPVPRRRFGVELVQQSFEDVVNQGLLAMAQELPRSPDRLSG